MSKKNKSSTNQLPPVTLRPKTTNPVAQTQQQAGGNNKFIELQRQTEHVLRKYGGDCNKRSFKRWSSVPELNVCNRRRPRTAFGTPRGNGSLKTHTDLTKSNFSSKQLFRRRVKRQHPQSSNIPESDVTLESFSSTNQKVFIKYESDNDGDHSDVEIVYDASTLSVAPETEGLTNDYENRLFFADGSSNAQLRSVVSDALKLSKFDSISALLASSHSLHPSQKKCSSIRPKSSYSKTTTSMFLQKEIRRMVSEPLFSKTGKLSPSKQRNERPKTVNAFRRPASLALREISIDKAFNNGKEKELAQVDEETKCKSNRLVCFNCWSADNGVKCMRHKSIANANSSPEDKTSLLLCSNWDIGLLRRRYRSEEIQEVFARTTTTLKYDNFQRKFISVVEYDHPIYRLTAAKILHENNLRRGQWKVRMWFKSFADILAANSIPDWIKADCSSVCSKIQFKRSSKKLNEVKKISAQTRTLHPKAPVTGSTFAEKNGKKDVLVNCIDNSNGQQRTKELILVDHAPVPILFFKHNEQFFNELFVCNLKYRGLNPCIYDYSNANSSFSASYANNIIQTCVDRIADRFGHVRSYKKSPGYLVKFFPSPTIYYSFCIFKSDNKNEMIRNKGAHFEASVVGRVRTRIPSLFGGYRCLDTKIVRPEKYLSPVENTQTFVYNVPPISFVQRPLHDVLSDREPIPIVIKSSSYHNKMNSKDVDVVSEHGFPLSVSCEALDLSIVVKPQAFLPSSEIVTTNQPRVCACVLASIDSYMVYPEPHYPELSPMKFFEFLKSNRVPTSGKLQSFTCTTSQQPGKFLNKGDTSLPIGALVSSVHRSWTFSQSSAIISQRDVISQIKDELGVAKQYDSYLFDCKLDQRRGSEHMISDPINIISLVPADCSSISSEKKTLLPNYSARSHSDNRMQKYHKVTSLSYDVQRIDCPAHLPHLPLHKVMEKSDLNIDREYRLKGNYDRSGSFRTMFGTHFFERYKHTLDKCIDDHVIQTFNTRSVLEIVHPVSKRNRLIIFSTAEYLFSFLSY